MSKLESNSKIEEHSLLLKEVGWQQMHTGNWSEVKMAWRDIYCIGYINNLFHELTNFTNMISTLQTKQFLKIETVLTNSADLPSENIQSKNMSVNLKTEPRNFNTQAKDYQEQNNQALHLKQANQGIQDIFSNSSHTIKQELDQSDSLFNFDSKVVDSFRSNPQASLELLKGLQKLNQDNTQHHQSQSQFQGNLEVMQKSLQEPVNQYLESIKILEQMYKEQQTANQQQQEQKSNSGLGIMPKQNVQTPQQLSFQSQQSPQAQASPKNFQNQKQQEILQQASMQPSQIKQQLATPQNVQLEQNQKGVQSKEQVQDKYLVKRKDVYQPLVISRPKFTTPQSPKITINTGSKSPTHQNNQNIQSRKEADDYIPGQSPKEGTVRKRQRKSLQQDSPKSQMSQQQIPLHQITPQQFQASKTPQQQVVQQQQINNQASPQLQMSQQIVYQPQNPLQQQYQHQQVRQVQQQSQPVFSQQQASSVANTQQTESNQTEVKPKITISEQQLFELLYQIQMQRQQQAQLLQQSQQSNQSQVIQKQAQQIPSQEKYNQPQQLLLDTSDKQVSFFEWFNQGSQNSIQIEVLQQQCQNLTIECCINLYIQEIVRALDLMIIMGGPKFKGIFSKSAQILNSMHITNSTQFIARVSQTYGQQFWHGQPQPVSQNQEKLTKHQDEIQYTISSIVLLAELSKYVIQHTASIQVESQTYKDFYSIVVYQMLVQSGVIQKQEIQQVNEVSIPDFVGATRSQIKVYESPIAIEMFEQNQLLSNEGRGQVCVLKNLCKMWPAYKNWKTFDYLFDLLGSRTVPIEVGKNYVDESFGQQLMTFAQFLIYHIYLDQDIEFAKVIENKLQVTDGLELLRIVDININLNDNQHQNGYVNENNQSVQEIQQAWNQNTQDDAKDQLRKQVKQQQLQQQQQVQQYHQQPQQISLNQEHENAPHLKNQKQQDEAQQQIIIQNFKNQLKEFQPQDEHYKIQDHINQQFLDSKSNQIPKLEPFTNGKEVQSQYTSQGQTLNSLKSGSFVNNEPFKQQNNQQFASPLFESPQKIQQQLAIQQQSDQNSNLTQLNINSEQADKFQNYQQNIKQEDEPNFKQMQQVQTGQVYKDLLQNSESQNTLQSKDEAQQIAAQSIDQQHEGATQQSSFKQEYLNNLDIYKLNEQKQKGYLAQHELFNQIPQLQKDIMTPEYCCLGQGIVQKVNIWFGPAETVTPLHNDPYMNMLCQIVGKKYVRLYDPKYSEVLKPFKDRIITNTSTFDLLNLSEKDKDHLKSIPYYEHTLEAGSMLFIP